jgi:acetyl-CoA carboxylase alpha subunit
VVDGVIAEPPGGAHRDPAESAARLGNVLERALVELSQVPPNDLVARRIDKYRHLGRYLEGGDASRLADS